MSRLVCLCFLLLFFTSNASAQDASTGALRGAVSDSTGARIKDATIAVANLDTGIRYIATSDSEGQFALELLPPGDYMARAEAPGMSPEVTPHLHVDLGGATEIDFQLTVAGAKETITVSGQPLGIETQTTAVSSVIDERAIQELPLNSRRFTDLALLTPGVTQDPRGRLSGSNGDLSFGGIRGFQTSYLVDGNDDNNAFFAQATGRYRAPYQFSNEVVQEFRVSPNTSGAENGRSGGAVVNVVTKSGSNHLHGSLFNYTRNSASDARQAFLDSKPTSQQQQFGFTVGGPIKRNRAFFFAGFDQHIFHVPTVVQFDNGSSVVTPEPGTGPETPGDHEASDQALVFASAAQLSQQGGEFPSKMIGNAGFAKLDFNLSPRNFLSLRLNTSSYSGQNNVFLDPSSPLTTFGISDNGEEQVATASAVLSLITGISPHLVSHFRVQLSRDLQQSSSNTSAPLTKITNTIDGFGRSSILPRQTNEHRLHLAETLSLEAGRQSWKFGADALLTTIYDFFPSLSGGEYIFDPIKVNQFTFEPQIGALELTPLRAYAHDVPHYYVQDFGSAVTHPNSNEYSAFIQDTIRVTNRLGLSVGARYDLQTFATRHLVSNPLWPDSGKVPFNPDNFAPRIGLAYSAGHRNPLVIRAGYGLFYTRIPQIYNSTVEKENGLTPDYLFLNNLYAPLVSMVYRRCVHKTSCTRCLSVSPIMAATLYTRHIKQCGRTDRNYHRCGCPVWIYDSAAPRGQQRKSAETGDWQEALKKAAELDSGTARVAKHITVAKAIALYLAKRSKSNDPAKAPYRDRYMLSNSSERRGIRGGKRQESLTEWAERKKFVRLDSVTASALDQWRDTWVFRPKSYALKLYSAVVKAFFAWAVRFEYLERNPFDKLDRLHVVEVPTLPLTPQEFSKLLSQAESQTMTTIVLTMRWSGLAVTDASCLRRDALGSDNRLKTYRKKTGEYVHVLLPAFVAELLRGHGNIHPDYFFWDKRSKPDSKVHMVESRLRKMYDAAEISPRGAHRFRDTFSVEFLNSGGLIEDLAMLLGHSSTATTWRHYAPWVKSRQVKLDSAVERSLAVQLPSAIVHSGRVQ